MGDDRRASEVRRTYDRIAEHFDRTRHHPWPEVQTFLDGVDGSAGLDVGCGNGRHLGPLRRRCERVFGLDASRRLLERARGRVDGSEPDDEAFADEASADVELFQAEAGGLPIRSDAVDVALYVATLHHLGSRSRRQASLDELARVLRPGGQALVSAWSTEHDRFDAAEGFDTTIDWTLPDDEMVPRYYHIYDPAEFRADLDASDVVVDEVFVSSGNCYAACRTRKENTL